MKTQRFWKVSLKPGKATYKNDISDQKTITDEQVWT